MINLSPFPPQDGPISEELFRSRIREWVAEMTADEISWILENGGSAQDFVAHLQNKGLSLDGNPSKAWERFQDELTARLTKLSVFNNTEGTA